MPHSETLPRFVQIIRLAIDVGRLETLVPRAVLVGLWQIFRLPHVLLGELMRGRHYALSFDEIRLRFLQPVEQVPF